MNTIVISSIVDLRPFTSYAPIFEYLTIQIARRAPSLLRKGPIMDVFLALYTSNVKAFMEDPERLLRDGSRTTIATALGQARQMTYPTHDEHRASGGVLQKPVWPFVERAIRQLLDLQPNARALRNLRLRIRYAWNDRVTFDDRLCEDRPDAGEPFEFAAALARFTLVLNRRTS